MKRNTVLLCFLTLIPIALLFAGCSTSSQEFPLLGIDTREVPVVINIYVQGTSDMSELLVDDYFRLAVEVLRSSIMYKPSPSWRTPGIEVNYFRFDVEWLEAQKYYERHGLGVAFAYPLDADWMPSLYRSQRDQILSSSFFELDWYLLQQNRAPITYATRFIFGNPTFHPEEQRHISRTMHEIAALRDGEREISIMITNFKPSAYEGHNYEYVRNQFSDFLSEESYRAISTFAFAHGFYFVMLGSAVEVWEFSSFLSNQLTNEDLLQFEDNFFTKSPRVLGEISNENIVDYIEFPGLRRPFERDLQPDERFLLEDGLVFYLRPRVIGREMATIQIVLDTPSIIDLQATPRFYAVVGDTFESIEGGNSYAFFDGNHLNIYIDHTAFSNSLSRILLTISIEQISRPPAQLGNELFNSVFTTLQLDIDAIGRSNYRLGEIFVYMIK